MAESNQFYLRVIAANKVFYSDYAECLVVTTVDGLTSFLAHHCEAMFAVNPGELDVRKPDGTWIRVVAGKGSVVFAHNRCTVLVETCETQEELDVRRAEEALERAKEELRQKQSQLEYRLSQAAMARAISRLRFNKDKGKPNGLGM